MHKMASHLVNQFILDVYGLGAGHTVSDKSKRTLIFFFFLEFDRVLAWRPLRIRQDPQKLTTIQVCGQISKPLRPTGEKIDRLNLRRR